MRVEGEGDGYGREVRVCYFEFHPPSTAHSVTDAEINAIAQLYFIVFLIHVAL